MPTKRLEEQNSAAWDRHAIKAEIHRKGKTLSGLARENDLNERGISVVFTTPYPAAERAIAKFLQVPLHLLWPDRYDASAFENSKNPNADSQVLSSKENNDRNGILVSGEEAA